MDVGTQSDSLHDFDSDDGPFLAWQAKAGFVWRTSSSMSVLLGYRFINVDDNQIDDDIGAASFELSTEQHVIELGLRFGF
jgi:opacity protein-like surface antigen